MLLDPPHLFFAFNEHASLVIVFNEDAPAARLQRA